MIVGAFDRPERTFETIGSAVEVLNRYRGEPVGRIRLNVLQHASALLLAPVLPVFVERYPEIEIDVQVANYLLNVVEAGADAGIRYGGTVPEDMVAQRLSADIRWVVAGSPGYLERHGVPAHPTDLLHHRCHRIRLGNDRIYRWDFEHGEDTLTLDVPGRITIDDTPFVISLAIASAGLAYLPEPYVMPLVKAGALRIVLEEWSSIGPGFYLYYPSRRQLPTGLRLLMEITRELKPLGL